MSAEPAVNELAGNKVGISLMISGDALAAVEHVTETQPDATIDLRGCFYKITREDRLSFDMAEISLLAGREIDTEIFLVNMATYFGRIVIGDGLIDIYSEIEPDAAKA